MTSFASKEGSPPARAGALPPPALVSLQHALGDNSIVIEWLAGDGSDRCYYRLRSKDTAATHVLMQLSGADAEALAAGSYEWITIGKLLDSSGVTVPKVTNVLAKEAALIIQDYGDTTVETEVFRLFGKNDWKGIRELYGRLIDVCVRMLRIPAHSSDSWTKRSFDHEKLSWELDFLVKHYAGPIAGLQFSIKEAADFEKEKQMLSAFLSQRSHFFVHRDFHSRNVMFSDGSLAVIDFQDSRLGPATYDLVSLIFDSYVPFDMSFRRELMDVALEKIGQAFGDSAKLKAAEEWRAMLLQRQLKAIGSFGYLTRVKSRGDYLKYVPAALKTLARDIVYDERWPFLSGVLIQKMQDAIE